MKETRETLETGEELHELLVVSACNALANLLVGKQVVDESEGSSEMWAQSALYLGTLSVHHTHYKTYALLAVNLTNWLE